MLSSDTRRARDKPLDLRSVPSATLDDLDRVRFANEYLPLAVAPDVLAANDRTYEQRLSATKMIASADEPTPTVIGLLVLGRKSRDFVPGASIQFLRIHGTDLADPITDEQLIDGSIADVVRRMDDKLQSYNRIAVDIVGAAASNGESAIRCPHCNSSCATR